jgi:hypothetical protein
MSTTENNAIDLDKDAAERLETQQKEVIRDGVIKELAK